MYRLILAIIFISVCQAKLKDDLLKIKNCGMRKSSSSNYIIDGRPVQEIGEQPWMVHIRNNLLNGSCGGSIINKNHILTAAHCIKVNGVVQPASAFTVHVGSIVRIAMKQDTFTVEKATYNSVFSKGLHDIAVLKLSKAIDFKKYKGNALPICLPAKEERGEEYTGQQGTVSGWGKTMRNQVIPTMFLQTASMKILSGEQCKKHYPFIRVSHLCGGPWSRGEYTCGGDSGSPLSITDSDGRAFQIGLVSVGKNDCGFQGDPTVFTRVDRYLSFIKQHSR